MRTLETTATSLETWRMKARCKAGRADFRGGKGANRLGEGDTHVQTLKPKDMRRG